MEKHEVQSNGQILIKLVQIFTQYAEYISDCCDEMSALLRRGHY